MHRFFLSPDHFDGHQVVVTDKQFLHQWMKVLRFGAGDEVVLCDGNQNEYFCVFEEIDQKQATLKIEKKETKKKESKKKAEKKEKSKKKETKKETKKEEEKTEAQEDKPSESPKSVKNNSEDKKEWEIQKEDGELCISTAAIIIQ